MLKKEMTKKMKKKKGKKVKKTKYFGRKKFGKKKCFGFFPSKCFLGRPNNSPPPLKTRILCPRGGELFGKLGYFHFFLLGKITMKKIPHLLSKRLLPCTQGTYIQEIWYSNFVSQKYPIQKFFYSGVIIIFFF